jgi:hypothetical protein
MREHEPLYLHDIVLPKEVEKPRRGFDLDREFGEGMKERMVNALRDSVKRALEDGRVSFAAEGAAYLRLLTGERFGTEEEQERMVRVLREVMKSLLEEQHLQRIMIEFLSDEESQEEMKSDLKQRGNVFFVARDAAFFRILTGERFGTEEEQGRMVNDLQETVKSNLEKGVDFVAAEEAALLRILTGERFGDTDEQERMIHTLKEEARSALDRKTPDDDLTAARNAVYLRILRAYDITFIPSKGIEIIDEPPEYKKEEKIPLPEVRKF